MLSICWNRTFYIGKYNWKRINYPLRNDDRKEFEKNNPTIALNILYIGNQNFYTDIEKNILPTFQNTTQRFKNKLFSNNSNFEG